MGGGTKKLTQKKTHKTFECGCDISFTLSPLAPGTDSKGSTPTKMGHPLQEHVTSSAVCDGLT